MRCWREQSYQAAMISGWTLLRFFQTSMGIVLFLGTDDGSIALMAAMISFRVTKKPVMLFEEVWGSYGGRGGNRCLIRTFAFSSKVVALLIVAMLGGSFWKAIFTVFQKFVGDVVSTAWFQGLAEAILTSYRYAFLVALTVFLLTFPKRWLQVVEFLILCRAGFYHDCDHLVIVHFGVQRSIALNVMWKW